jgi:hypothetical protein
MELGLGYVMGYHPENATVDIRTIDGTPYSALPFDANLAFYSTPVLPILRTDTLTGAVNTVKMGSFVMFAKFSDSNIKIIRIYNDDQDLIKNFPGHANRLVHGYVQDTLLAMMQDGEALISAPGRIIETAPDVFERKVGSWMLFKNSGDAILSNADSSCEVWVSYDGKFEANTTKYKFVGTDTQVQETADGDLQLSAGAALGDHVTLTLSKDAVAELSSGTAYMTLSSAAYTVSADTVTLDGGSAVNLNSSLIALAGKDITVAGTDVLLSADAGITGTATNIALSAINSVALSAGAAASVGAPAISVAAGTSISITAPKNAITVDETGTKITLDESAKITITVGKTSLEVSKTGVKIIPDTTGKVEIGAAPTLGVLVAAVGGVASTQLFVSQ